MMVTWGGMCGSVSGMNEQGLTVTINAAKSVIPTSVADPVSLIAREVLQYAGNIKEAYAIASKRSCFVSESFLIGSAHDNRAVVIEKSPYAIALYEGEKNQVLCTNHFQSEAFVNDSINVRHMRRSASYPRYLRLKELLAQYGSISVMDAARILRDQRGTANADIGMGNEKVLNQLIAHHSIIFKPEQRLVWVSSSPFQLGEYVAYDLRAILANPKMMQVQKQIYKKALTLPADTFLQGTAWQHYQEFRQTTALIVANKGNEDEAITEDVLNKYLALNALFFYGYEVCGDYCYRTGAYQKALDYYKLALGKDIPTLDERERIESKVTECQKKTDE
jgi:tetratricopeptide (TPR) repeat protein